MSLVPGCIGLELRQAKRIHTVWLSPPHGLEETQPSCNFSAHLLFRNLSGTEDPENAQP